MPPQPVRVASPPSWIPQGGLVIPANTGYTGKAYAQVVGQVAGRETVSIANIGASSCLLFAAANQPIATGITLASGNTYSIDTEGEIWVASSGGTTLDVVSTFWQRLNDVNLAPLGDITGALK